MTILKPMNYDGILISVLQGTPKGLQSDSNCLFVEFICELNLLTT
jgi:hypothetical protein